MYWSGTDPTSFQMPMPDEWKGVPFGVTFCKVMVSDLIEKNATPEQKAAHIDIADWIIYQIRDSRDKCRSWTIWWKRKESCKNDMKEPRPSKADR